MILDTLNNSSRYVALHPRLARAFELIATTDWMALNAGIHELEGRDIFVNVMDTPLKEKADAKIEVHDAYMDIQVLITGEEEGFGWSPRAVLTMPQTPFDQEKDVQFYNDVPQTYYTMRRGEFSLLLPEDGHAPMVGTGNVRKIIVKVRI